MGWQLYSPFCHREKWPFYRLLMCKKCKQAQLCGDLDKNLIPFVTLWAGLCEDFHRRRIVGQTLANVRLSFFRLSIIYSSREWKPTMQLCVSAYMFVSWVFFHVWVQRTMLLFFCIAHWYRWPGVKESRSASLQISKGDWEGLDSALSESLLMVEVQT